MWPFLPSQTYPWVPTYYLFTSLAFIIAIFWGVKRAKNAGLDANVILDSAMAIMVGAFIGGRLFHVAFEAPAFYMAHPSAIFEFWFGGFVFYGGFLGALIAVLILKRRRPFDFFKYADLVAPVIAFGYGVGRLGCFTAGCCFGRPTDLPWGMIFPPWSQAAALKPIHPTQLYATGWEWMVTALLLFLGRKKYEPGTDLKTGLKSGQLFGIWLILHGIGRAWIEQFRDDFRGQFYFNLSISTWLSILVVLTGFAIVLRNNGQKKDR